MSKLPYSLYRAEQVRALDNYTINTIGISGSVLMERAGAAAFNYLKKNWPMASTIGVICGTGNNGGDGFVVARLAKETGHNVLVLQMGDVSSIHGDALSASQRLQSMNVSSIPFDASLLSQCDVLVDAIFGTGLRGEVTIENKAAIFAINASKKPVLALDIPSGLNADNGNAQGTAVKATATISFVGLKQGMFTHAGKDYCGEIIFSDLSIPISVFEQQKAEVTRIDYESTKGFLKPRLWNTHKGHYGHVFIIGGEHGYTGAVRMAGEAALRTGAGLVTIGTRKEHAACLNVTRPELMVHGLDSDEQFNRIAERASVIAIGPGLGQSDWAKKMLSFVYESGLPVLMDADALNLLALTPRKRDNWILTPHVGEAARMIGLSTHEIQDNRFRAVKTLQDNFGGIAVLKGPGTLIAASQDNIKLCSEGNPGMATGGMGDVLTGAISGLIAQGLSLIDATSLGVCLHAAAADALAKAAGMRGMLASDLMPGIRRLVNPEQ